jgi:hypothetical protein
LHIKCVTFVQRAASNLYVFALTLALGLAACGPTASAAGDGDASGVASAAVRCPTSDPYCDDGSGGGVEPPLSVAVGVSVVNNTPNAQRISVTATRKSPSGVTISTTGLITDAYFQPYGVCITSTTVDLGDRLRMTVRDEATGQTVFYEASVDSTSWTCDASANPGDVFVGLSVVCHPS